MKRKIAILALVFISLISYAVYIFTPKFILKTTDDIRINYIIYNGQFNIENADVTESRMELKNYDSEKVIACLSDYKSQQTLKQSKGYAIKDCQLELFISVNGEHKTIVLGNVNFEDNGTFKKDIINSHSLLTELLGILDI